MVSYLTVTHTHTHTHTCTHTNTHTQTCVSPVAESLLGERIKGKEVMVGACNVRSQNQHQTCTHMYNGIWTVT